MVVISAIQLFSQVIPDYSLAAFGLYHDVVKVEAVTYDNKIINLKREVKEKETFIFENGLLKQKINEGTKNLDKFTATIDYLYNTSGKIIKETEKYTSSLYGSNEYTISYSYSGDKLTLKEGSNTVPPKKTTYNYNNQDKLIKAEIKYQDGKLNAIEEYSNLTDNKNYVKKTTFYSSDGKITSTETRLFRNGKCVEELDDFTNKKSYYKFVYDAFGNMVKCTDASNNTQKELNFYGYDSRGNWIQCKNYNNSFENNYDDVYTFRKIYFENNTSSGSTNFDTEFYKTNKSYINTPDKYNLPNKSIITEQNVQFSGDKNGYGMVRFENGDYYEGFFKNGLRNGPGGYIYANGNSYIGMWSNDLKDGYGILKWNDGSQFSGYFSNDTYNGEGIYINYKKGTQAGIFKDGISVDVKEYGKGTFPTGCYCGNCKDGFGKKLLENKDQIIGFFDNEKFKNGVTLKNNNDSYTAEFEKDKLNGFAYFQWKDGTFYIGTMKNDKNHGLGLYKNPSDPSKDMIGEFKDGVLVKDMKVMK